MRIGIMGGTFDPIHNGHLILARDACEALNLHRMIFVPNRLSPHKLGRTPGLPEVRAAMVRAAIEGEHGFEMDDFEIVREGPSYTIDTLLHLQELHPHDELYYLLGEDNLDQLHTWRRAEEIPRVAQIVVMARGELGPAHPYLNLGQRRIDISATDIRARIANGKSIRYLVPDKVLTIIQNHQLYLEAGLS